MFALITFLAEIIYKDSDSEHIHATLSGDKEAFGRLVEKYERLVYNISYQIIGSAEDAFDISQETFIKAYKSLGTFRGDCKFSTWLYKICNNTANDFIRSKKRKHTVSLTVYDDDDVQDGQLDIADNETDRPEAKLEKKERQKLVREAIAALSEDHRTVVVLRDIEGYSYDEISEILNLEIGTVKSRLNRARQSIKEFLLKRNIL